MVARTSPGRAKTILISWALSHGPSHDWRPKQRMKIRPEITGEIEKGRSIKVMRRFLPGKRNFAIAHAATTPKTRLSGTLIAATSRVSLMADKASGSRIAAKKKAIPFSNACANTAARGTISSVPRKSKASPVSNQRTIPGSVMVVGVRFDLPCVWSDSFMILSCL